MQYNFDKIISRKNTYCVQWDYTRERFGRDDITPFSISDLDFKTSPEVLNALKERVEHGIFGYTRWENDDFKNAIQLWHKNKYGLSLNLDSIVYSPGILFAISLLLNILLKEGDALLINTPSYDGFLKILKANNIKTRFNPLKREGDYYSFNFEEIEREMRENNVKVFLLCSPHNPTGRVFKREELLKIVELAKKYNVFIISDEIHREIAFKESTCILEIAESYKENIIVCSSPSKVFNLSALNISYLIINNTAIKEQFIQMLTKKHSFVTSALGVTALISAYTKGEPWLKSLIEYLKGNIQLVKDFFKDEFSIDVLNHMEGTYLAWLNFESFKQSEEEIFSLLVNKGRVGLIKGSDYMSKDKFFRMNIGCPREKLFKGFEGIKKALK